MSDPGKAVKMDDGALFLEFLDQQAGYYLKKHISSKCFGDAMATVTGSTLLKATVLTS